MKRTRLLTARPEFLERAWMTLLTSAVVVAAMLLASGPAGAISQRVKNACKSDYFRHCPAYHVGTPQLRTCMTKAGKRKQLSRQCLRALIDNGQVPRRYLKKL